MIEVDFLLWWDGVVDEMECFEVGVGEVGFEVFDGCVEFVGDVGYL